MRVDGRAPAQLRDLRLDLDFTENPLGSVLCRLGRTVVLCTVCAEETVPRFLQGTGRGWITAEYSMLPGSTDRRVDREASRGKVTGRTQEIQRLIGRSLRSIAELGALGERTFHVDCDVLQADGGTRTASIIGGYTALAHALGRLVEDGVLPRSPLREGIAAISVGMVGGEPLLDLCYAEDARADVDMNVVATASGRLAEVQGTGEEATFSREDLDAMIALALDGIEEVTRIQAKVLAGSATG
jgi:ribonuclease PH